MENLRYWGKDERSWINFGDGAVLVLGPLRSAGQRQGQAEQSRQVRAFSPDFFKPLSSCRWISHELFLPFWVAPCLSEVEGSHNAPAWCAASSFLLKAVEIQGSQSGLRSLFQSKQVGAC